MSRDFSEERKIKILDKIKEQGKVLVIDLVLEFKVSDTTIRRDLDELASDNLILRTHGGALISNKYFPSTEVGLEDRKIINLPEKKNIAMKAKEFINNGDLIIIGGGTTCLELTKILDDFKNLKILTNSLETAYEISTNTAIELTVIGGKLNRVSSILTGIDTINYLDKINVDKLFFSVSGIDLQKGLTNPISIDAEIISKMIDCSETNYLLADSNKFGKSFFKVVKTANKIDKLITDNKINIETSTGFEKLGIDLIIT
jgi:DeoR family transcriptional regulator, fructose operon transcriptional repressor